MVLHLEAVEVEGILIACPDCTAGVGENCFNLITGKPRASLHNSRIKKADRIEQRKRQEQQLIDYIAR